MGKDMNSGKAESSDKEKSDQTGKSHDLVYNKQFFTKWKIMRVQWLL